MNNEWNPHAAEHIFKLGLARWFELIRACPECRTVADSGFNYCSYCGYYLVPHYEKMLEYVNRKERELREKVEWLPLTKDEQGKRDDFTFPTTGIYIYYHPYERYKIGKGEKIVQRRIPTHKTTAPSLELLHVIETSDLDWCENFLHEKFRHRRIWPNHEYFDLTKEDLDWLFSIKVLEPPRKFVDQLNLLDLL